MRQLSGNSITEIRMILRLNYALRFPGMVEPNIRVQANLLLIIGQLISCVTDTYVFLKHQRRPNTK